MRYIPMHKLWEHIQKRCAFWFEVGPSRERDQAGNGVVTIYVGDGCYESIWHLQGPEPPRLHVTH